MTTALLKKIFLILITILFTIPVLSDDKMDLGLEVFNNKATCVTCHVLKTAGSTHNCNGATLYLTMSPCKDCSKLIHQAGIKRVVYMNKYKDTSGIDFLIEAKVDVLEIKKELL